MDDSVMNPLHSTERQPVDKENDWILGVQTKITNHLTTMNTPEMSYIRLPPNPKIAFPLKRAVSRLIIINRFERDRRLKLMQGKESSQSSGFHWYIIPDSRKYQALRYSRAICIFANFIIIPLM